MHERLISICIPAYNRPEELGNLLESIDCNPQDVEVVIIEDCSPGREKIREVVEAFKSKTEFSLDYSENASNLGFDGNLRALSLAASGRFILFMGDDDLFVRGSLDRYLTFLNEHRDFKYVLRSYNMLHPDGSLERFRYFDKDEELASGQDSVAWLFKRSVTICGFTIDRKEAIKHSSSELDGTLLYQVYLMSQVCMVNPSIYCDIPIAQAGQSFRKDKPMFGNAVAERSRYIPGRVSEDNSINFTKAYFEVAAYLDSIHNTHLVEHIQIVLSKYSYPFLSIQRKRGISDFLKYSRRLELECGFGKTVYFHAYKWALFFLGECACDALIRYIKKIYGKTPDF
jgi:glycosyltransferase involved in cell wall biosynthesis